MSRLNQLKRWLGLRTPEDSAMDVQRPGQRLMTLEERMAFRREMVFEAVREVLAHHGVPLLAFKLNVARLDTRGHRYAVMVDLFQTAGRVVDAPGEWHGMESQMIHAAEARYRVKIVNVYWRCERPGREPAGAGVGSKSEDADRPSSRIPSADSMGLSDTHSLAQPLRPVRFDGPAPGLASAPQPPVSTPLKSTSPGVTDGFPDTVLEDRLAKPEPIGTEELLAFEEALRAGHQPRQPVKVGGKTYQTDFMPLD